jgi:hypothetical protein
MVAATPARLVLRHPCHFWWPLPEGGETPVLLDFFFGLLLLESSSGVNLGPAWGEWECIMKWESRNPSFVGIAAAMVLGLAVAETARAAAVTWGLPTAVSNTGNEAIDELDVDTRGAFVDSASFQPGFDPVVNGVTFHQYGTSSITIATDGAPDNLGAGTADTYNTDLLGWGGYVNYPGGGPLRPIVIGGLTSGLSYEVQLWTPYWAPPDYPTTFSDGTNSVDMGNTYSVPTFVIGTFTADDTSQTLYYTDTPVAPPYAGLISAIQVRAIPEPASLGMLAVGGLGLLGRRRSKR